MGCVYDIMLWDGGLQAGGYNLCYNVLYGVRVGKFLLAQLAELIV